MAEKKKKPEVVAGPATYVLKAPHYRNGNYYAVGDKITVVDEAPSVTWERVPDDGKASKAELKGDGGSTPPPSLDKKRPSEKGI